MDRAYSLFEIKEIDEEKRIVRGIATTPATDRMEDIVDPMGGVHSGYLPFLWQHQSREAAVGEVVLAKPTSKGIPVEVHIESDDVPGILKDRLDYAWRSIKKRLVRGLSIGFRALEVEPIKDTYGLHFKKWEWLELSAVTIPANAEATIQSVKSYDTKLRAASGTSGDPQSPGVPGTVRHLKSQPRRRTMLVLTVADNIANLEASREAATQRMEAIATKVADEGRTKDDAEREEYDTLRDDIAGIDSELKDLRDLERIQGKAKAVDGTSTDDASTSRSTRVVSRSDETLEPGIEFARFAMCQAAAKGDAEKALKFAERHYPRQKRAITVLRAANDAGMSVHKYITNLVEKASIPAGTTAGETWAGPLLAHNDFASDFLDYLRPRTIIGQFGQGGIPALARIPFNVNIKGQTSGGSASWVGQGKPKPVTKYDFSSVYHGFYKIAAISVITEELIRFSDPSAERLVRDGLAGSVIERMDTDFVDPDHAAAAGVSPASITNGLTPIGSTGADADDVRADIAALWADAITANLPLTSAVYITTPAAGLNLSLLRTLTGAREFPDIRINGGTLDGIPVITSNYVPAGDFILAFASEIWLSDDGVVTVDASREASIEMLDSSLVQDATVPTATSLVSMYQTDSVALRAHRFINWSKRRAQAVAYIADAAWATITS